jgi:hypothetical protein
LDGRLSGCLCSHEVRAPEPNRKRHMARLHNSASRQGCIGLTLAAAQHYR